MADEIAIKAYPLTIRWRDGRAQLLLFDHPLTMPQLPKGGIELGEEPLDAARRELFEETGLQDLSLLSELGSLEFTSKPWEPEHLGEERQRWHMFLFEAAEGVADRWDHRPTGGSEEDQHVFGCRWADIEVAEGVLHPRFGLAVRAVAAWLKGRARG